MSTGRRLAKRSIIGTKVCAPGPDGLWYSGVIQDVKTPPTATVTSATVASTAADLAVNVILNASSSSSSSSLLSLSSSSSCESGTNLTADTKYIVRFDFKTQTMQHSNLDMPMACTSKSVIMEARRAANLHTSPAQTLRRNAMIKEFRESDLIGPGFRSILGIHLQPGQRVFLTYNGRETSGDVVTHDAEKDEVIVKITAIGTEEPIELKKRLEEVRLLESRRSARLADQDRDTDFARLADMGGDRRRTSHSIEVPLPLTPQHNNSRKRPTPYSHDFTGDPCNEEEMNECNAALILMKLSHSPKSPQNGDKWLGSSPGSSSASWSSGSSSPPLSDDGNAIHGNALLHDPAASARIRTTSVSTSDEGIVVDFKDEGTRKKRANKTRFLCTWKGCNFIEHTNSKIERHIRNVHLGNKKARRSAYYDGSVSGDDSHEEEFYYTEIEDDDDEGKTPSPTSPPTLSHRDMARPPHEDPEYQRQIVGNFKQGRAVNQQQQQHGNTYKSIHHSGNTYYTNSNQQQQQLQNVNSNCMPTSPLAHHNYTWPSATVTATAAASVTAAVASTSTQHQQHQQHQQQQQQQLQSHTQQQQQQQQQQHGHQTSPLTKHAARASPRPSQSAAPYPSPTYVHHHHHNYSSPSASSSSNSNSNNSAGTSNIIHSNSSANNVLQQLSQQNVTVTAHHSHPHQQPQQQQQQQQLSAVTITPNYHPHQQHSQQQQHQHQTQPQSRNPQHQQHQQSPTLTASNNVATSAQHQQQHSQAPHAAVQHTVANAKHTPNSPNRRARGENKKCRKVYGMDRRDQWCTQCRWKKACTRFGD